MAIITTEQYKLIEKYLNAGYTQRATAMLVGVSLSTVHNHKRTKITQKNNSHKVTFAVFKTMLKLREEGYTYKTIGEMLNLNKTTVSYYTSPEKHIDDIDMVEALRQNNPVDYLVDLLGLSKWIIRIYIRRYNMERILMDKNLDMLVHYQDEYGNVVSGASVRIQCIEMIKNNYDSLTIQKKLNITHQYISYIANVYKPYIESQGYELIRVLPHKELTLAYQLNWLYNILQRYKHNIKTLKDLIYYYDYQTPSTVKNHLRLIGREDMFKEGE